jgi:hypothetical protein
MSKEQALHHLEVAQVHLKRVQIYWDSDEPDEAVNWAFYAYENAVVAVAEILNIPWAKTHPSKVKIAEELYSKGILSIDVGPTIAYLNELRKDVQYGEAGDDLADADLEDMANDLEQFITEVENVIKSKDA